MFPSRFPLYLNYLFSLLLQLSLELMRGYAFVLSSSFYCLEVMIFSGFYILGRNRIYYILMEAFTFVCPFISKNITEYLCLASSDQATTYMTTIKYLLFYAIFETNVPQTLCVQ